MAGCIRRMVERKVDGVAIMTSEVDREMVAELTRRNIPTVFMDTGKAGPHSANIRIDYAQGIDEALQHLFLLNHRHIAFIAGPGSRWTHQAQLRAGLWHRIHHPDDVALALMRVRLRAHNESTACDLARRLRVWCAAARVSGITVTVALVVPGRPGQALGRCADMGHRMDRHRPWAHTYHWRRRPGRLQ